MITIQGNVFRFFNCPIIYIISFKNGVKYDLAEYLEGVPWTFKFDETMTSQVKKTYDAYVRYWSKVHDCITSNYLRSHFVCHCCVTDLVDHYKTFKKLFKMNNNLLLHLGMDGPKVNLSFETKLKKGFDKEISEEISSPNTQCIQKWFTKSRFSFFLKLDSFFTCQVLDEKIIKVLKE